MQVDLGDSEASAATHSLVEGTWADSLLLLKKLEVVAVSTLLPPEPLLHGTNRGSWQ